MTDEREIAQGLLAAWFDAYPSPSLETLIGSCPESQREHIRTVFETLDPEETPTLTEQDAEAVLMALGSELEWVHDDQDRSAEAETVTGDYIVERRTRHHWDARFFSYTDAAWSYPHKAESLTAAKAACEHHHRTGEWP